MTPHKILCDVRFEFPSGKILLRTWFYWTLMYLSCQVEIIGSMELSGGLVTGLVKLSLIFIRKLV